ncbi:MAG: universal stress protein [Oceanibaculum sp.]
MKRILAATDFSDRSEQAVRRAALLARRHGASLALIHVVDDDRPAHLVEIEHRAAALLLEERAQALREDGIETSALVRDGAPSAALLAAAAETGADLVVIGAHRRHLLKDVFLGTTAERIIRHSSLPVLMVNRPAEADYRHILLAVDLSDASRQAVRAAQSLGFDREAEATVLHLYAAPATMLMIQSSARSEDIRRHEAEMGKQAWAELAAFLKGLVPADTKRLLQPCNAGEAEAILAIAREIGADLAIVGTHGKGALSRLLLGSVAEGVLRLADRDVLAVPPALPG